MIWADTDIPVPVKKTAHGVMWADRDIRLIVKTTAQGVIWADTDRRLIVKIECANRADHLLCSSHL